VVERVNHVAARLGVATPLPTESFRGQSSIRLPADKLLTLVKTLRDDEALAFEMLMDLTCVHWPRRPLPLGAFDVVYHLTSLSKGHRIRLKVACPDPEAGVPSVVAAWAGANLMEREAYDMFGVRFEGHPDLRRVLMGEDFAGWPMRKDFPYRGH
jgi:NADH-quinone oxidoreductase subunit C